MLRVQAPQQLGKYLILSELPSKFEAELSEAYDPTLDRRVLLVRLRDERAWHDAQALAQLDHPSILRVSDLSAPAPSGLGYLAFALPGGGALADRIAAPGARPEFLHRCLWQAGQGLAAAHAQGFVHRELDASAVLLTSDGDAQLFGFTCAQSAEEKEKGQQADLNRFRAMIEQALAKPHWLRKLHLEQSVAMQLRDISAQLALRVQGSRRNRWFFATLAAGLAIGGVAVALQLRAPHCPPLSAEAAALWSGSRASTIRSALLRSGKPYAADAARRVTEIAESYLARFNTVERALCAPPRGSKQPAETVRDLRIACLQGQLRKLDATLQVLGDGAEETVQRAVSLVDNQLSTAELEGCLQLTQELSPAPPPPQRAADVARARAALARIEALGHAGNYQAARAQLDTLTALADASHHPPLQAEAAFWRGQMLVRLGEYDDSVTWLHRAASIAESCRHDRVAAQAWMLLMFVISDSLGKVAQGAEYEHYASASLQRCQRCDDLKPALDEQIGFLRYQQGRSSEALQLQKQVLAHREQMHTPTAELLRSYNSVSNVLDSLERPAEAAVYYQRAIKLTEKEYGLSHPLLATLLSNLADVQESLGQLAEAEKNCERALDIVVRALGEKHRQVGRLKTTLGGILMEAGRYDEARVRLNEAIAHYDSTIGPQHPLVANALINLGTLELRTGRSAEALTAFMRALQIREAAYEPTHLELAFALLGAARAQLGLRNSAGALPLLTRARQIVEHTKEKQVAPKELHAGLWFTEALYRHLANKERVPAAETRQLAERAKGLYQELGDGFRYETSEIDRFLAPP